MILSFHSFILYFIFLSSPMDIFSLLLEREEGGERNIDAREKHRLVVPTPGLGIGDRTHNLCMCPGQESNLQPFGYRMTLQPAEPHQPGSFFMALNQAPEFELLI